MYNIQSVDRLIQVDSLVTVYNYTRPKGFYFPGESHDFWECVYIHEGEVTATADEKIYQLGSGCLLLHKPMEFHRIWADKKCAPWVVNISFQAHGELTEKLAGLCIHLNPEQQKKLWKIINIFTKVEQLKETDEIYQYRSCMNITASLLEVFLIELSESKYYNPPSHSHNDERYTKIVQVMQTNRHKNLSLSQLADLCGMSTSNMKRVFHLYSDIGIAKYFLTLRMRYAMELLDKGKPANQIAEILNFPDAAYFYTVFKRETNMTPSQYRNRKSK